jgi:hypothetical protein
MLAEIQSLLTLIATGAGIYVAIGGLNAWKRELTGKRDLELCQEVVEKFYEAEEKFRQLRSPFSYSLEGAARAGDASETPQEKDRRDYLFVPLKRWNDQADFWSSFFARKFRMRALFGDEAVRGYDMVDDCLRTFRAAASTRYESLYRGPEELDSRTRRAFEEQLWAGAAKPDKLAERMREAIQEIEKVCIPVLRAERRGLVERLRQMRAEVGKRSSLPTDPTR